MEKARMKRNMVTFLFSFCSALGFGLGPAHAHEFWIAPNQYQVAPQETITAKFKNGEDFAGVELGYFARRTTRHEAWNGTTLIELSPRDGDRPAFTLPAQPAGLMILAHETVPSKITYKSWEKFANFAKHKDFANFANWHQDRGLPPENFSESYTRHAKTLIAIGNGSGTDHVLGLAIELVALSSPYAAQNPQALPVLLLLDGAPRKDAQIEIFEKAPNGAVHISLSRTGADGVAQIPIKPGHEYLLDAVTLREPEAGAPHDWETLWASLTFYVPSRPE